MGPSTFFDQWMSHQLELLTQIRDTLTEKLKELEEKIDGKPNSTGEINILGEVDGVPAEISGAYEIAI